MAGNIIVTSAGLDLATSAHTSGPLIALKYCLPVYDYRIDGNVHNEEAYGTSAIDISAAATSTDTTPTGEIIYNIDEDNFAYALSTDDNWVIYTGSETVTSASSTWEVSGAVHSKEQKINLYDGTPLDTHISGTSVTYVSATPTGGYWSIENAGVVTGDNTVPTETSASTGRYFPIDGYYPTETSTARGSFKCRISKDIGKVKFNKLALYAVQLDSNGNETSDPVLFAQAMLTEPITKTNVAAQGFDDVVIDVQIQMNTVAASFSEVFYSTSGDYWARTPGGLYYSERVGIGTFLSGTETPKAMLDVKSTSAVDNLSLRSWDNDDDYWLLSVESDGDLVISGTSGDVIIPNYLSGTYLRTNTFRADSTSYLGGNTVIDGTCTINSDATVQGDLTITGQCDAASFDNVQCTGIISATNDITTLGRFYCNDLSASDNVWTQDLFTDGGQVLLEGNIIIGLDASTTLDIQCDTSITGEVTATSGDFTTLSWTNLNGTILASQVDNDSSAPGADVDDALGGLNNRVTSAETDIDRIIGSNVGYPTFINGLDFITDTANTINIYSGSCSVIDSSNNIYYAHVDSSIYKYINTNWTESSGGFPSALTLTVDTWYHVFIIYNSSNGSVNAGFDTSTTAANLLSDASNYDSYRRIGSIYYYNDGANDTICEFKQKGDYFYWGDRFSDNYLKASTGSELYLFENTSTNAPFTPLGIEVKGFYNVMQYNTVGEDAYIYDAMLGTPSTSLGRRLKVDSGSLTDYTPIEVWSDTSGRIGLRSIAVDTAFYVICFGWMDPRGQY